MMNLFSTWLKDISRNRNPPPVVSQIFTKNPQFSKVKFDKTRFIGKNLGIESYCFAF
jgi:hypothetical protein